MAKSSPTKKSTSRKTSKAVAKKPAAAKKNVSAKRKTTVKPVSKPKSKVTVKRLKSTRDKWQVLRGFHVVHAAVSAVLIAMTVLIMGPLEKSIYVSYVASDALLGPGQTAPAIKELVTVDVRWLIVAILALSAGFALFVAFRAWGRYRQEVEAGRLGSRWLMNGVTGGLLLGTAALLVGMYDIFMLKFVLLAPLVVAATALMVERLIGAREKRFAYLLGGLVGLFAIAGVGMFMLKTYIYGMVTLEWYVYAAAAIAALALIDQFANQGLQLKGWRNFTDRLVVERNYVLIALVAQVAFAALLIIGFSN